MKIQAVLQPIEHWDRIETQTGTTWVTSFDDLRATMTYLKSPMQSPRKDRLFIVVTRGHEICDTFATWEIQTFEQARNIAVTMAKIARNHWNARND